MEGISSLAPPPRSTVRPYYLGTLDGLKHLHTCKGDEDRLIIINIINIYYY